MEFRISVLVSVSDDEAIETASLLVLVTYQTVAALGHCLPFNVQKGPQVLEKLHLVAKVFGVVLDVALVRP